MDLISKPQKEKIFINGESHTLKEWSKITNIHYDLLWQRHNLGKSGNDLLKPVREQKPPKKIEVEIENKIYSMAQLSETTGIPARILRKRHFRGKRDSDLLKPIRKCKNTNTFVD